MSDHAYILLIHPDTALRTGLQEALRDHYEIVGCDTPKEGLSRYHDMPRVDLVLVDGGWSNPDFQDTLNEIESLNPDIKMIFLSAQSGAGDDVREGHFGMLAPNADFETLKVIIDFSAAKRRALRSQRALVRTNREGELFAGMIGESPAMKELKSRVMRVAPTQASILLTGESGTGKEVAARSIVAASMRADKPFITVNAAAIPDELIESELFGHEKGAFTNAVKTKKGKFELAHEGTLFLDEIGDMPYEAQAKLLRVLENHEVDRVGSERPIKVDVRVIAATNADLLERVRDGKFREDLYYRLEVIQLTIPPLRERREDIPLLVGFYLERLLDQYHNRKVINIDAVKKLMDYHWPGNIRQLRNCLERAYLLSTSDEIMADDIEWNDLGQDAVSLTPATGAVGEGPVQYDGTLEDLEMKVILDTLERTGGNKTEAARVLGIGTKTLYRKLEKHRNNTNSSSSANSTQLDKNG